MEGFLLFERPADGKFLRLKKRHSVCRRDECRAEKFRNAGDDSFRVGFIQGDQRAVFIIFFVMGARICIVFPPEIFLNNIIEFVSEKGFNSV